MDCPCSSGKAYDACCKPFHEGRLPDSPLQLMRSRYSAYALDLPDYIIETTHPDHPQFSGDLDVWRQDIRRFSEATRFERLEIIDSSDRAVTFRAHLTQGGQDASFTEKSLFETCDGRWFYKSGQFL